MKDRYGQVLREKRRQTLLKREATMSQPGKPETYEVEGRTVTLTKQPMVWGYTYEDGTHGDPAFKAKYKVELDGEHVGWIVTFNGWGTGTAILRVNAEGARYYSPGMSGQVEKAEAFGRKPARAVLAERVPALCREGKLGTVEQLAEIARQKAEERARAEAKQKAYHKRVTEESAASAEADAQALNDRIAALQAIAARGGLSNYEADTIDSVIAEKEQRRDRLLETAKALRARVSEEVAEC